MISSVHFSRIIPLANFDRDQSAYLINIPLQIKEVIKEVRNSHLAQVQGLSIADHDSGPPNLDINQSLNGILFKGVLGTREPWNPTMLNQAHHQPTKF
jgi:hypothetical protein